MTGRSIIFEHVVRIISFPQQFCAISKFLLISVEDQKWIGFDILEFIITDLCMTIFTVQCMRFERK